MRDQIAIKPSVEKVVSDSTSRPITVAVAGANGKMGREAVRAIGEDPRFKLAAVLTRQSGQALAPFPCPEYHDPAQLLMEVRPDVWLDFTDADSVVRHVDQCIAFGVRPVVGATGYSPQDVERWNQQCLDNDIGGIAAPNFAIGALLMIRFASEAARFFSKAEIVEYHHDGKKDAPSGTAKRTAESMAQHMEAAFTRPDSVSPLDRRETGEGAAAQPARGLDYNNIRIHSVRLPGLVAHQEVMFGGTGEILTIRHDSLSRTSFMPGVLLACSRVINIRGMVYGLENLLW
jgi:4-hydroxy-tetrahydrodipicolinate reductase